MELRVRVPPVGLVQASSPCTPLLLTPRTRPLAIISKDSQRALSLVEAVPDYVCIDPGIRSFL